ncbi:hypothetical protein HNO89_001556 [Sporosarcina luteola]|nr:hypothetical protein [Sporosarcina luteola]
MFSGKVIGATESGKNMHRGRTITFQVDEVWKGIETGEIDIKTGLNDGDCGFPFMEGKSYLIFAKANDVYGEEILTTTICQRTNGLAEASDDIAVLGKGKVIDHPAAANSHKLKSNVITGQVAGSCFLFLLVMTLVYFWRKNRKR